MAVAYKDFKLVDERGEDAVGGARLRIGCDHHLRVTEDVRILSSINSSLLCTIRRKPTELLRRNKLLSNWRNRCFSFTSLQVYILKQPKTSRHTDQFNH